MESSSDDILIRDLVKGQVVPITVTTRPGSAESPVLSPDLKQIAYAFAGPETGYGYQLRVSAAQSDAKPRLLGAVFPYLYVRGWSADARSVFVVIIGEGNTSRIAWMSTIDGTVRTLKSFDWQAAGRPALSPDGRFIAYDVLVDPRKPEREIRILASDASAEFVVVSGSAVNSGAIWSRDGARLAFKSNRSGTLGIWSVPIRNGRDDGPPTLLKPEVGDVGLIGFTATNSLLYEQRIGTQDIFAIDLDSPNGTLRGTPTRLAETYVGANRNPSLSPDGKSVAYLSLRTASAGNTPNLVIRSLDNATERVIPTMFRGGGSKPMGPPMGRGSSNWREIARTPPRSTRSI